MKITASDTHLGGEDFEIHLVYHLVSEFKGKRELRILLHRVCNLFRTFAVTLSVFVLIEIWKCQQELGWESLESLGTCLPYLGQAPFPSIDVTLKFSRKTGAWYASRGSMFEALDSGY